MTIKTQLREEIKEKYSLNIDDYCPKNDEEAWLMYPKLNYVYNKMFICEFQNLAYAPMPILPNKYPVIIKPIINLMGMGINSVKVNSDKEFMKYYNNNHFWCEFLQGDHNSWDFVITKGKIQYICCFNGCIDNNKFGTFKYWSLLKNFKLPKILNKFIFKNFKSFTGCINIETIGDKMIECHLRMGDIDQLPKDYLRIFLLNYICKIENVKDEIEKLPNIGDLFLFPVWQEIKNYHNLNTIYKYLERTWENELIKDNNIIMYYFDKVKHSYPNNFKRWFLFTIKNFEEGILIKNKIQNDIINKFL